MMAAIANDGVMMLPMLTEEIRNGKGETIFAAQGRPLRSLVSPATAGQLSRMLATTVNSGTSRKIFHDRRGRARLASLNIAAKTGSINGKDPLGHYSWFAAYAPADDPQIALAALVINQDKWKIKASYLGEQALEAFFK
jgi:cell division protein FtsI/penicillin-binding protein 2